MAYDSRGGKVKSRVVDVSCINGQAFDVAIYMCSLHMHFHIVIRSFILAVKININHILSLELFG
jgi:hypothetical protein